MPVYKYVAVNAEKQQVKGKFIAADEKELASELAKQNLYIVSSSLYNEDASKALSGAGKVPVKELATVCRQFAIMLTAGVSVLGCLENLKKQMYSYVTKLILQVVYDDVKAGEMLSEALNKNEKALPGFFLSMVKVGEASGRLDKVFVSLAEYYETDMNMKRKVKSALAYPMMLLGMTVAIVILMLTYIVPTFQDTMATLNVEVTGFTKTVYDISDYLLANWYWLLLIVLAVVFAGYLFLRTEQGKYAWDVFKIYGPIIKKVQVDLVTARFSRAFALLLSSGMGLAEALDTVSVVFDNRYLKKRFEQVSSDVRQGVSITVALKKFKIFPDMLLQMVAVGEETASLDEVLNRTCSYFDQCVESTLSSLTAKIQPVMLLIMGATIGSLFVAVYSPMISIMTTL